MEFQKKINIKNKKAYFDYEIDEKYIAGMVLTGTEIKSLRMGKASLVDSYCFFIEGEIFVKGINIGTYDPGTHYNHMPIRDRKLLLNKIEIRKLQRKVKEKGFTIIPLLIFLSEKGYAKLEIGLAKGKREYDKRETIKQKDVNRELDRARKR
jgi:SsrA-binding protein